MTNRARFLALLVVLLLIGGLKVGQELYLFYSTNGERMEIVRLEERLRETSRVLRDTKVIADSLRAEVERMDEELGEGRERLEIIEQRLMSAPATSAEEASYLELLDGYNSTVVERNEAYRRWEASADEHRAHVEGYNAVADSIRALASAIGEPYYRVSMPDEWAEEEDAERSRR